jgi:hypothetical protein
MLGVLLAAQALVSAGPERTALQCGLVLAGFGAMIQWARGNRAALDHLDWCQCASAQTTIRVIQSGGEEPGPARRDGRRQWIQPEPGEPVPVGAMKEIGRQRIADATIS